MDEKYLEIMQRYVQCEMDGSHWTYDSEHEADSAIVS